MKDIPDFGIGIADCSQLKGLLEKRDIFLLELPGALLGEAAELQQRGNSEYKIWFVRELCPHRVMAELPEASLAVKREFLRFTAAKFETMYALGATQVLFNVDVARCCADRSYFAGMKNILLNCCAQGEKYNIRCGIEARIPGNFVNSAAEYLKFRREIGYPLFMQYDFHIHEPGSFDALTALAEQLPFDREGWRITFDLQSGNFLSGKMLQKFLPHVRSGSWESPYVIFAPGESAVYEDFAALKRLWDEVIAPPVEAE